MPDLCPDIRFTSEEAQVAAEQWGFNCGPASLCAVLGKTPAEVRPYLLDFERKRYTNPTLMADILRGLGLSTRRVYECAGKMNKSHAVWPESGLVRVQWGGPWCAKAVPVAARYRKTHWVAVRGTRHDSRQVFDVNSMNAPAYGGWVLFRDWEREVVPWIIEKVVPNGDGSWWPTHCWEVS